MRMKPADMIAALIVGTAGALLIAQLIPSRTIEIYREVQLEDHFLAQPITSALTSKKVERRFIGYKTISAYDPSDPSQTRPDCVLSHTCCIGASGHNLCDLIAQGTRVAASNKIPFAASNKIPFGTIIEVGTDHYEIQDRTAEKYGERIDIAMLHGAKEWGIKVLPVYQIIEN